MKRCVACGRAVDDESGIVAHTSCPWCGGALETDPAGVRTLNDAVQVLWTFDYDAPYNGRVALSVLKDLSPNLTSAIRDIGVAGDVGALVLLRDGRVEGARRVLREDAHWDELTISSFLNAYRSISPFPDQWDNANSTTSTANQPLRVDLEPTLTAMTQEKNHGSWDIGMPPHADDGAYSNGAQTTQAATPSDGRNSHALIAILAVALVTVAAVVVVAMMRNTAKTEDDTVNTDSVVITRKGGGDDVDIEDITIVVGPKDESESELELDNTSVVVKGSLAAYSWAELSEISKLIQDAGSWNDGLSVAQRYNLVDQSGHFPSTTKEVVMLDGTTLRMRLIDIMHDELSSGGGVAGMTFLGSTVTHHGRMSGKTTTDGGWQSSEMRSWMNTTLFRQLPSDVSAAVVQVRKLSNNVGKSKSESCVSATDDYLWLPSIVELTGPVNWEFHTDPSNAPLYNAVFNAEGSQYAYYSQNNVVDDDVNKCLSLGEDWWLRSTAASTGRGRYVNAGGDPSLFGDSNQSLGVVVGYCV